MSREFDALVEGRIDVLTPTSLEYLAALCVGLPTPPKRTGVALADCGPPARTDRAVLCGLAGGLAPAIGPGTVLIPALIRAPDGSLFHTDPVLRDALVTASRSLGFNPETGPLLTAPTLITGGDRRKWADRGYVAADMEAAAVAACVPRFATVRVVLDSAARPISVLWLTPGAAMLDLHLWRQGLWLARVAPLYALRAARVTRDALLLLRGDT